MKENVNALDRRCRWCHVGPIPKDAVICLHCGHHQSWFGVITATGMPAILGLIVAIAAALIALYQASESTVERRKAETAVTRANAAVFAAQTAVDLANKNLGRISLNQIAMGTRSVRESSAYLINLGCGAENTSVGCTPYLNDLYSFYLRALYTYLESRELMTKEDKHEADRQLCWMQPAISPYRDRFEPTDLKTAQPNWEELCKRFQ